MKFLIRKKAHFLILSLSFVWVACAIQAPEDYYFQFALMEAWGTYNRQETGRTLHEAVVHPENTDPLVLAFEVGSPPAELLGFVPYEVPDAQSDSQPANRVLPKVPISLQQEALSQVFQEKNIQAISWRLKNGRLEGKQNLVQVHFIPRALSERAIQEEFLIICAIVYGSQTQENTVDVVRGIAEAEDGTPEVILEAQIANYTAYLTGQIDGQEWENRLQVKNLQMGK